MLNLSSLYESLIFRILGKFLVNCQVFVCSKSLMNRNTFLVFVVFIDFQETSNLEASFLYIEPFGVECVL